MCLDASQGCIRKIKNKINKSIRPGRSQSVCAWESKVRGLLRGAEHVTIQTGRRIWDWSENPRGVPRKRVAVMACCVRSLCQYETNKLVRIQSYRLGSMKWSLNGFILLFIWWGNAPKIKQMFIMMSCAHACASVRRERTKLNTGHQ